MPPSQVSNIIDIATVTRNMSMVGAAFYIDIRISSFYTRQPQFAGGVINLYLYGALTVQLCPSSMCFWDKNLLIVY